MYKHERRTCKVCKNFAFIVKYANLPVRFLSLSSSWLFLSVNPLKPGFSSFYLKGILAFAFALF